jgi:protein-histidine pros-kinase
VNSIMGAIAPVSTEVVDIEAARSRLGGNERIFRTIVRFFFEDSPGLLAHVRGGVERQDAGAVGLASHRLKGLLSNFGAHGALVTAARLEELAGAHDWVAMAPALTELEQEIARVREALGSYK